MRVFKVPFDIKREEKIFGGYLSLRQVVYLMLGASSFALLATPLPMALKIIFIFFSLICREASRTQQALRRCRTLALPFQARCSAGMWELF